MLGPEIVVPLAGMTMVLGIVIGRPIVNAWVRRMEKQSSIAPVPPEVMTRLERMEQSIEAIAVEVERISEGQRFTTRLLSETRDAQTLPRTPSEPRSS